MIFHFMVARNLVAEHCLRDFDMIFYFETSSLKTWLQSTMKKNRLTGLALAFMAMDKNISWTCLLPLNFKQPLKKILKSAQPPPSLDKFLHTRLHGTLTIKFKVIVVMDGPPADNSQRLPEGARIIRRLNLQNLPNE